MRVPPLACRRFLSAAVRLADVGSWGEGFFRGIAFFLLMATVRRCLHFRVAPALRLGLLGPLRGGWVDRGLSVKPARQVSQDHQDGAHHEFDT